MLSTVYILRKQRERHEEDEAVKQRKRRFWVRDIFKNKNSIDFIPNYCVLHHCKLYVMNGFDEKVSFANDSDSRFPVKFSEIV